ncbi:hypothetical protein SAMN04488025_10226 [Planifilum fulgidum]|uniref:Uncharacterized protein n=1 Tax=Planifilum fulgidum TaxID=201973 RepID=A0A1I2KIB2_9BACL|nr:hypothetical protein SAMN04488025_10226 [Planifilum fulgidum]
MFLSPKHPCKNIRNSGRMMTRDSAQEVDFTVACRAKYPLLISPGICYTYCR